MQFHLNGFQYGDPEIQPADPRAANRPSVLPDEVDVLVAGSGPAGLVLGALLSQYPGIHTRVVERREGPLTLGQADGIAVRSVEMFRTFGFSEKLCKEAYWVNETVFWRPDPADRSRIVRAGRIRDTEDGLSEFPHLIVNQARIHDYLIETMRNSPSRAEVDYGWEVTGVEVASGGDRPVAVRLRSADGADRTVRAKYVVGCDGARSAVRQAIGRQLKGDVANHAWGVMDILAVTDFPDIRLKAAIQSANQGNILLIPREGGYLVRLYVDLGTVPEGDNGAIRKTPAEHVIAVAQRVLAPYTLEVKDIAWFSVYEVGQRVTDKFDDVPADQVSTRTPRVFIAGDACHTHSAKAGQGMNVSMQDAFNLGWKLAAVLEGRSPPTLLHTYSQERQAIAQGLIDFDKEWSKIMGSPPRDPEHPERGGVDPAELQAYFQKSLLYTAGVATHYPPQALIGGSEYQALAKGYPVGKRFHSAPVIRVGDAKRVELGHVHKADGAWRLYAFADRSASKLHALLGWLVGEESPILHYTPAGSDIDSVIDVRGIYQQGHRDLRVEQLPALLLPRKGRFGLVDYEKAFAPDLHRGADIFDLRSIDRERGALVVVRPDQYVAQVLPLSATEELGRFFGGFMLARR